MDGGLIAVVNRKQRHIVKTMPQEGILPRGYPLNEKTTYKLFIRVIKKHMN